MRIVYFTTPDFLDSDLSLLRQYKVKGNQLVVFVTMAPFSKRGSMIDIHELKPIDGIVPFADYKELDYINQYIDTKDFFFVQRQKSSVINLAFVKTVHNMCKMIDEFKPDVVHTTMPLDTVYTMLLRYRKRLVVTLHDPFLHSGKGGLRQNFFRWLSIKSIPRIVLLNKAQASEFQHAYKVNNNRILINKLSDYDSLKAFTKFVDVVSDRCFNILFLGKIASYKGLEYLCQAMPKVKAKCDNAVLTIAGGGKLYFDFSPYKNKEYIKLINRYVGVQEVATLLSKADVVVCPYKDATQSGVIMSAFALERPIVASDVGALGEQIENGRTGVLVKPCDIDALADALIYLYENRDKLADMRENIRRRNCAPCNQWSNIADKYLEFYKR